MAAPKPDAQIIHAKWKTDLGAEEQHFGTLFLDETFQVRFPILSHIDDIPQGAKVLWGITEKLRRCTVRTLPYFSGGSCSDGARQERTFSTAGHIRHLFIGSAYIENPESASISKITFRPQPNGQVHIRQLVEMIQPQKDISAIEFGSSCESHTKSFATSLFACFEAAHDPFFEIPLREIGATITAWIGGTLRFPTDALIKGDIMFTFQFDPPRSIESALEECNRFCVFLSFITHRFAHPEQFSVEVEGHSESFEFHSREFPAPEKSDGGPGLFSRHQRAKSLRSPG